MSRASAQVRPLRQKLSDWLTQTESHRVSQQNGSRAQIVEQQPASLQPGFERAVYALPVAGSPQPAQSVRAAVAQIASHWLLQQYESSAHTRAQQADWYAKREACDTQAEPATGSPQPSSTPPVQSRHDAWLARQPVIWPIDGELAKVFAPVRIGFIVDGGDEQVQWVPPQLWPISWATRSVMNAVFEVNAARLAPWLEGSGQRRVVQRVLALGLVGVALWLGLAA